MKYEQPEPEAKKCIDEAKESGANVIMMVDGYQTDGEAIILRDFLWYARDNGVVVTIVPK